MINEYKLFEIDTNILMYSSCMSHQKLTKTYCHLDFKNANISLSNNPFLEETHTYEIKIIDNYSIFINVPINTTRQKLTPPNETLVSLHKSNLQKAIRLGNKTAALTSLEWLYRSDPIQLFRRLPIILLEDASIHPYFSLLVLYSIVYNQIDTIYDNIIYEQLKQVVLDAIANPTHQRSIVYHNTPEIIDTIKFTDLLENADILFMYIRYCYGGLPGDMIMLQRFILYSLEKPLDYCEVKDHSSYRENPLETPLLLSAVDFHVFPKLLEDCKKWLMRKQIFVDTDTIKSTIWNCRSRTNFRESYLPSPPIWWNELVEYLDKESKQYWDIFCAIGKNTQSKADIFCAIGKNTQSYACCSSAANKADIFCSIDKKDTKIVDKPVKKTNTMLNYFKQTKSI